MAASLCWSEGGQVTDLPAGVTQETYNYMLVTAMLDLVNHAAAMSEMLPLGIKENKQAQAALAAVVTLSSDYPAPPSAVPPQHWLAQLWGEGNGSQRLSKQACPGRA